MSCPSGPRHGIETLPKILYPCHPTRYSKLPVYSCTKKNWMVPVLRGPFQANSLLNYLKEKQHPFYSQGKGQIVCPPCVIHTSGEEYRIVYYSRSKFKDHFERRHQHLESATYQGFATGYNTRMYEAMQIHTLCSGNNNKGLVNQRSASPFKNGKCTPYEVHYSSHLREFLLKNGTIIQALTLKLPKGAKGVPEVVELGDEEEKTEPEPYKSSEHQGSHPHAQSRECLPKRSRSCSSKRARSCSAKRYKSRSSERS
jgi:hypothetical protein